MGRYAVSAIVCLLLTLSSCALLSVLPRCTFRCDIFLNQETPDEIPEGETPATATIFAFDDLVDAVRPGDRCSLFRRYILFAPAWQYCSHCSSDSDLKLEEFARGMRSRVGTRKGGRLTWNLSYMGIIVRHRMLEKNRAVSWPIARPLHSRAPR